MDDDAFRRILDHFDLSWAGYRRVRKGVKKRLARHMQEGGQRSVDDYLRWLETSPHAAKAAHELLTVSISRFYRDRHLWEVLEKSLLPKLACRAVKERAWAIRAWSAGCSCGEEAYSLRMAWDRARKRFPDMPAIEVWATDMSPAVLERARVGIYGPSSVKGLPAAILQAYFKPDPAGFAIREELKQGIHWVRHDFIQETPPCAHFDLVLLRNNLLTYFDMPIRIRALSQIVDTLPATGLLVIGDREELPSAPFPLERSPKYRCIFQKTSQEKGQDHCRDDRVEAGSQPINGWDEGGGIVCEHSPTRSF